MKIESFRRDPSPEDNGSTETLTTPQSSLTLTNKERCDDSVRVPGDRDHSFQAIVITHSRPSTLIKADEKTISISYAPPDSDGASVSFVVMMTARSDGIRRYNFDSAAAAMRRFELESANCKVHKVESLNVISSRTVSR